MRRTSVFLILTIGVTLVGAIAAGQRSGVTAQEATPSAQELEAIVQRYIDAYNTGDVDSVDDVLAPDWVAHPQTPGPGTDIEKVKGALVAFRAAFPDLLIDTQDFIIEGNQVVVRSTMTGTHEGTFLGVAATGTPVTTQFIDIHRIEGGRIVETYHVEDLLGVLIQIGGISPVASPEAGTPAT